MTTYRHTPDMGEISGFGNGYEETCQNMLEAGVKFLVDHPKADFQVKSFENFYGICSLEGEDADAIEKAVIDAAAGDCTGAQHQAVMSRLKYISVHGWEKYCQETRLYQDQKSAVSSK